MTEYNPLAHAVVYLSAAVVIVPLATRIGLGSVLGYLAAGIAIGPWGLQLVTNPEAILHFAEFGVVLLLFMIGLELSPKQMLKMRRPMLQYGGGQLLFSTLALTGMLLLAGLNTTAAVVGALAMALSSTAIALQILKERNLLPTSAGQSGFAILLVQDLAVIPILALMPLISGADVGGDWLVAVQAVAMIGFVIIAGHYAVPIAMRAIASTGIHELFTAFALLLVIGIALLMNKVGLSMALGSFLAGLLLANSEYRHALETVIDPFKGLLMGLFFMAVGMSVDFGLLALHPLKITLMVFGLVLLKGLVLYGLARFGKLPYRQIPFFSILLSQGGEFAFVVLNIAVMQKGLTIPDADLLVLVVALSMMSTPILLALNQRFIEPRFARVDAQPEDEIEPENDHVIVAGFGRFGQIVGRLLHSQGIPVTLLDQDPGHIERIRRFGFKVFFGNAQRLDLLRAAGAERARLLVIAIDSKQAALEMARVAKEHFPNLKIVARAWDMMHQFDLRDAGITEVHRETFSSALGAAAASLKALDFSDADVDKAIALFREHDREVVEKMYAARGEGEQALARTSIQLRDTLNQLYQDAGRKSPPSTD